MFPFRFVKFFVQLLLSFFLSFFFFLFFFFSFASLNVQNYEFYLY
jgi:hypothetical protein